MSKKRSVKKLAKAIRKELAPTYDLVYVEHDDKLRAEQVAAIVAGESPWADDDLMAWESESKWVASGEAVTELAKEIVGRWIREDDPGESHMSLYEEILDDFELSPKRDEIKQEIEERDTGAWCDSLLAHTPAVLLRIGIPALDEDVDFFERTQADPAELLTRLGFEHTPENVASARELIENACTTVGIGYLIAHVDVEKLYKLPVPGEVDFIDPYIFLGNPFAGAGYVTKFTGTLRVKREDFTTDRDAFGYGVAEILGGVSNGQYEVEMRPVEN